METKAGNTFRAIMALLILIVFVGLCTRSFEDRPDFAKSPDEAIRTK